MDASGETRQRTGWLRRLARERLLAMAALAVPLFLAAGLLRPTSEVGVNCDKFWYDKLHWRHCADVVAAGDSRVYIGVCPTALRTQLAGRRVLNFGFSATGYSPEYLQAIEDVLDPASQRPAIVLGITPYSLTRHTTQAGGFRRERERLAAQSPLQVELQARCGRFLDRIPLDDAVNRLLRVGAAGAHLMEYCPDGWVAVHRAPQRPRWEIDRYLADANKLDNFVDPAIVGGLIGRVAEWRRRGIRVFGFRPPTPPAMRQTEQELMALDERDFVRRFRAAGGTWIEVDPDAYPTFDGSHLRRDDAVRFSQDLARQIAANDKTAMLGQPD